MKRLQLLVPQYKEDETVIKPLLDSIALQQNVDFNDIGVIICNDGTDVKLSDDFIKSYPYDIIYKHCEHQGVSATRNECFNLATAEYVMFCDADDMFFNNIAFWFIFQEIERSHFDSLTSVFMEETRHPVTKDVLYVERGRMEQGGIDGTFVHGKVHRRKYLLEKNIRWNKDLTIHEDSYFNILCQNLTDKAVYCPFPFYLWKWRDESVCRHDPKYILKTYNNMLDSNTALVKEFLRRNLVEKAIQFVVSMTYDAYMTMNKKEWIDQENQEYRINTELRFKKYYEEFKYLYDRAPEEFRNQIYAGMKNRFMQEGMFIEEITFKQWMQHINELKEVTQ